MEGISGMGGDGLSDTAVQWRRTREGDLDALAWLVGRVSPLLRAHALYRLAAVTVRSTDLDDLVQEAWMVLLLKKDEVEFPEQGTRGAILAYLGQVILNKANNLLRREARRRTRSGEGGAKEEHADHGFEEMAVTTARALRHAEQQEAAHAVAEAVAGLAPVDRDIVMQRLFEGRTNKAIGGDLGLEANTVAQRYRRAVESLRALVGAAHAEVLRDLMEDE